MEAMRDVGVRRVLFTSSGAIYGNQAEQPVKEDAVPHPRSPYAVSKLAAEYYIHTIGELWGIETVSLRIFNVYGPGQYFPAMLPPVIPNFLRQSSQGGTLVLHGDGSQTRDYLYIDDAVTALGSAITAQGVNRMTINVGSGRETSVRDLVRLVADITGGKPEVIYNPRVDGGPNRLCANIKLAKEKLNFSPTTSLETGLRLTLERDPRLQRSPE
jgi:UDP-glucose 4-epimerase